MALDTSYNGLLAVNCLPINLKQVRKKGLFSQCPSFQQRCRLCKCSYSADTTGVVLRHVVFQGQLTGVSPRTEGLLTLIGLGITGLLSQVVKLEGDFVMRVKEASVAQVSVLCYQNLHRTVNASVSVAVHSGIIVAISDKTNDLPAIQEKTCLIIVSINFGKDELVHVVLGKRTVLKQNAAS